MGATPSAIVKCLWRSEIKFYVYTNVRTFFGGDKTRNSAAGRTEFQRDLVKGRRDWGMSEHLKIVCRGQDFLREQMIDDCKNHNDASCAVRKIFPFRGRKSNLNFLPN